MGVLIALSSILVFGGGIFYNKLRTKYYGIVGVGGSYFITIGLMVLGMLIGQLIQGFGDVGASAMEIIILIVVMLAAMAYMVFIMLTRCTTVMQRVFLPFACLMIAFGFCLRLLLAIVFRIPMSNGAPAAAKFPASLTDDQGDTWNLQSDSGDHADYYCPKNGNTVTVWYTGDYVNLPAGWRAN